MTELDVRLGVEKYGGWVLLWFLTFIPIALWFSDNGFSNFTTSPSTVFLSLGKLAGLAGLVLYAINLLLAARTRWMESFFGGLNRVYIAHHLTGGIALILLCFHPLFLAVRYIDVHIASSVIDAAKFLWPRSFATDQTVVVFQDAVAINAGIIAFLGMVVLLVITFFINLPYRIWLITHKFLGVAFMFAGLHVILINSDTTDNAVLKWYMLFWVVVGLSAFIYRSLMSNIFVRRYGYRVTQVDQLPGRVVGLTLEPIDGKMSYKPGQFVFIRFLWEKRHNVTKEAHPFSIVSSPKDDTLKLCVKSLGDYTSSMKNIEVGAIAEIEGAYGKFTFTRFGNAPQVWIAGGIGITPFLSMAHSYDQQSPPVDLLYSVVERSELLDQESLSTYLPNQFSTFRFHPFVSQETGGFLTAQKIVEMVGDLNGKEIFICGPPPMMKSLKAQLHSMGIPKRKIHTEEFSMS